MSASAWCMVGIEESSSNNSRGEYSSLLDHIGDLKKILGREISKGFGREISRGSRKGPKGPQFEIFLQF